VSYAEFLARKMQGEHGQGLPYARPLPALFDFQNALVEWSLSQGRAAIFADCGLGKTPMQLAWADNVHAHTGKPVLVITPLAVAAQTTAEAAKFGYDAAVSRDGSRPAPITVTNYERVEHFNSDDFGGVVCDESSAIKAFDGQRRALVTEFLRTVPYRLLCTATAAPNDYVELGTSSEALGYLGHMDMLGRFFVNDQNNSALGRHFGNGPGWRFKGHAEQAFWRWVVSWARAVRRPSDLGFADDGYELPRLVERQHIVEHEGRRDPDALFDVTAQYLAEQRRENRLSIDQRVDKAAGLLAGDEPGIAWCQLNDESQRLTQRISGSVELAGGEPVEAKEEKLTAFSRGDIRVLVTKPSIGAWGLNWQHCARMTYFASHSYEQYYQAVRRCWRFGQTRSVTVDVISTPGNDNVLANLRRKAGQADAMFDALVAHMNGALSIARGTYDPIPLEVPSWAS
jgi:hypothetical protein